MASLPSPTQVAGDHEKIYETFFRRLDTNSTGTIQAGPAAQFLKKSGLNDNILSKIWDISDPGGKGYLDQAGFYVALKLIAVVQSGKEAALSNVTLRTPLPDMSDVPPPHPPPPHPPPPAANKIVQNEAPPVVAKATSAPGVWTITPPDRTRYDKIFNSLGPEANKIHGNKVRGVMMNSKLPMEILGKIWDLSDMDKDGSLDRVEFSIAMHLIYKVLENNPLPNVLPQEMLSSARRAGVAQGPTPAPLAPPSQLAGAVDGSKQLSGPPPAPWVVSEADKMRYDVMFHNADLDKDGFVSGQEIKGIFLQSGLPQLVLAHIWNVCDMKQTGKLSSEQFALAMWLIQQKMAGIDPPATLTPEMIPPTMRPKPANDIIQNIPAKPEYSNPELQMVADEIEKVNADRLKLEAEIQQKEASIRVKSNEMKNLQTELDTLNATYKQLEHQKGEAQKRLDDLGNQKRELEAELKDLQCQVDEEQLEVSKLKAQVEEQEESLKAQEEEVQAKKQELDGLRMHEMELEGSVVTLKKRIEHLTSTQQQTQLFIAQAKNKIGELQDTERHMIEVLTAYDSAISSGDASSLSESSLREITPKFSDSDYLNIGPSPSTSPKESPVEEPQHNGLITQQEPENPVPKAKDTSFIGGHDPFAAAFGTNRAVGDPFASWEKQAEAAPPALPASGDPFGGDAFAPPVTQDGFAEQMSGAAAKSESPTPVLPPKKTKPPPRPAPPKSRPAKPPPPQLNSNNNPIQKGSFGSWNEKTDSTTASNGGFADFANFDKRFNSEMSRSSAWAASFNRGQSSRSPWPDDPPDSSASPAGFDSDGGFTSDQGFASDSGFGAQTFPKDPVWGDYDPFKGTITDKFSWDDEPDPFVLEDKVDFSKKSVSPSPCVWDKDPFKVPSDKDKHFSDVYPRSQSALGDPKTKTKTKDTPFRSKTSLGQPLSTADFDPFSSARNNNVVDRTPWKSNEDLLTESLGTAWNNASLKKDINWNSPQSKDAWPAFYHDSNFNHSSEESQFVWAAKESLRLEEERRHREDQEQADLELAISLSKMEAPVYHHPSRSPSTGL